jgi:hypothetical protein
MINTFAKRHNVILLFFCYSACKLLLALVCSFRERFECKEGGEGVKTTENKILFLHIYLPVVEGTRYV